MDASPWRRPPRVYYILLCLLLTLLAAPAAAQVTPEAESAMTHGPANARVTIIEFSDYQ